MELGNGIIYQPVQAYDSNLSFWVLLEMYLLYFIWNLERKIKTISNIFPNAYEYRQACLETTPMDFPHKNIQVHMFYFLLPLPSFLSQSIVNH